MTKDLVIFDGSNFYHSSKKVSPKTHLTGFNYRKLAETITKSKNINIEYCVGEIRQERENKKSVKMYANQQALFYNLERQRIVVKKRSGSKIKNKDYGFAFGDGWSDFRQRGNRKNFNCVDFGDHRHPDLCELCF